MGKILCALALFFLMTALAMASPDNNTENNTPDSEEFWPPDMVPHPHPPGGGPKKDEPELA